MLSFWFASVSAVAAGAAFGFLLALASSPTEAIRSNPVTPPPHAAEFRRREVVRYN
jgi:hypothetical protein